MPNWLSITILLLAVLTVGAVWERRRFHRLRRWAEQHQAQLHWPVDLTQHPELPAAELVARFELHGALQWASAVAGMVQGRRAWVLEYRATPPGLKSSVWYCLMLVELLDAVRAQTMADTRRAEGAVNVATAGTWLAERHKGLMTPSLLHRWFEHGAVSRT